MLLVRLSLDKNVPTQARMLIGGALAYFVLPFDLLPEAIVGVGGYVDDLVLATAVLSQAFGGELEPYARKHWSGSEDLREWSWRTSPTPPRTCSARSSTVG